MARDPASRYKPGHRSRPQVRGTGKISENRAAWCKTVIGQFVLMLDPPENADQVGTDIRLHIPRPGMRDVTLNLTAMTVEELDAFEQFITLILQTARPVCEERDKVAQDALDQGDDSHGRVYRQAPQFIVRSGAILADHAGLRRGLEGVPEVEPTAGASDGGIRGRGDALAEPAPDNSGPEDDGSQA